MAQDLRNLFKEEVGNKEIRMSKGHEARFLERLDEALPVKKKASYFNFLNIAASVILLLGLSYGVFTMSNQTDPNIPEDNTVVNSIKTLGDVSPDLKKVEDYYLASINLELSKVQLTPANKDLVDGYIERLKELNEEYDKLTEELNENGPNAETLDALIANLKFRLNLVMRLKDKLSEYSEDAFVQESI